MIYNIYLRIKHLPEKQLNGVKAELFKHFSFILRSAKTHLKQIQVFPVFVIILITNINNCISITIALIITVQ